MTDWCFLLVSWWTSTPTTIKCFYGDRRHMVRKTTCTLHSPSSSLLLSDGTSHSPEERWPSTALRLTCCSSAGVSSGRHFSNSVAWKLSAHWWPDDKYMTKNIKPLILTWDEAFVSSSSKQAMHKHLTDLGWDRTPDTAELLDGTIQIVSVADHNAHHKLHIRLYTQTHTHKVGQVGLKCVRHTQQFNMNMIKPVLLFNDLSWVLNSRGFNKSNEREGWMMQRPFVFCMGFSWSRQVTM